MIPHLVIRKRKPFGKEFRRQILISVVDIGKSCEFPRNFVCILPRSLGCMTGGSNFAKEFGAESLVVAKSLLSEARSQESDPEILEEICFRLKRLSH